MISSKLDFNALPNEVVGVIINYLDLISIINFDITAHRYHKFFKNAVPVKLNPEDACKLIKQFFTLAVLALPKILDKKNNLILENLLNLYPELLTYKLTVQDHAGRKLVNRTGYQITLAYAADNIYPIMEKHFLKLPNGEEIRRNQFKEQFPHGVKVYLKYDIEKARIAFHRAKELI